MGLLERFATIFFDVFGITHPTEAVRRRATIFLCGMLVLVAIAIAAGAWALYHLMGGI